MNMVFLQRWKTVRRYASAFGSLKSRMTWNSSMATTEGFFSESIIDISSSRVFSGSETSPIPADSENEDVSSLYPMVGRIDLMPFSSLSLKPRMLAR